MVRIGDVKPEQLTDLELLIIGSPTQKSTSLPSVTRYPKSIPDEGLRGVEAAAFGTRVTMEDIQKVGIPAFFVRLFGYAAKPILGRLERKAGEAITPAEGFFVADTQGPLTPGEPEQAATWAQAI